MLKRLSQNLEKEKKKEEERQKKLMAITGAKEHIILEELDENLDEESEVEIKGE